MITNNNKSLHQNGPCSVQYGSLYGYTGIEIKEPAILIDTSDEIVTLLKYGNEDIVKAYYNKTLNAYEKVGLNCMCKGLRFIRFNMQTGFVEYDNTTKAKLNIDEVCTLINWINNCINTKQLIELFNCDESMLHKKLEALINIGF